MAAEIAKRGSVCLEAVPVKAAIVSSEIQIKNYMVGAEHYSEFDFAGPIAEEVTAILAHSTDLVLSSRIRIQPTNIKLK